MNKHKPARQLLQEQGGFARRRLNAAVGLSRAFATMVNSTTPADRSRAIMAFHLAAWEDEKTANILRSAILAAANEPAAMERVRTSYGALLLITQGGLPEKERLLRAALVGAQFVGLAMMHYIWRIEPLASLPREELAALVTPIVERYLNGPLHE